MKKKLKENYCEKNNFWSLDLLSVMDMLKRCKSIYPIDPIRAEKLTRMLEDENNLYSERQVIEMVNEIINVHDAYLSKNYSRFGVCPCCTPEFREARVSREDNPPSNLIELVQIAREIYKKWKSKT